MERSVTTMTDDTSMKEQRRGRRIAMTPEERDAFLNHERIGRVATVSGDGRPHVVPLWFVWDGAHLWLNSLNKSQRWTDLMRDPHVAIVVDAGHAFHELRGVEITGAVEVVGEVPRTSTPNAELAEPELLFARKYAGSDTFVADGRHAWLRVTPDKLSSWDFRKNAALQPAAEPGPARTGRDAGLEVMRELMPSLLPEGDVDFLDGGIADELPELGLTNLFGSLWTRPGLDRRSRSLVTLGILIAQGAVDELQAHFAIGRVNGLTDTEISEVVYHATGYAGYPAAAAARRAARAALEPLSASNPATSTEE
jgi:alkylhydroperoxidase/carboxymuconolactone decarboxylase family protein YurZ